MPQINKRGILKIFFNPSKASIKFFKPPQILLVSNKKVFKNFFRVKNIGNFF